MLTTNLEHYYKLEADGTDSLVVTNLSLTGTPTFTAGKINNAIVLNGSSQYGSATMNTIFGSDFSISMWVNVDNITADMRFFESWVSSYNNYWFVVGIQGTSNDRFYANLYDGTNNPFIYSADSSVVAGNWYHLVFVRNTSDDKIYLYVNGVEVTSGAGVTDSTVSVPTYSTAYFGVGKIVALTEYTDGKIDEIGIWSRALSSAEVTQLYNSGNGLSYDDFQPVIIGPFPTHFN